MIIAEINTLGVGSTGKIMFDLAETARRHGHTVYTYSAKTFRRGIKNEYPDRLYHTYYGTETGNLIHKVLGGITGFNGYFSSFSTRRLIHQLEQQKIDILHLHNLHEFCINLPMLFRWIKKNNIRIVWTLHDCWTFTGHCPYFTMVSCDKWKTGCGRCPQKNIYPKSLIDTTSFMWKKKKQWFTGVKDLTIVTPSEWLAGLVKESFLAEYPVEVINNGIDLDIFKPMLSDFRKNHGIEESTSYGSTVAGQIDTRNMYGFMGAKYMVLGVSFGWGRRKGLDVFIELAKRLDPKEYQIVLIGTDDAVDQKLPDNILSVHRTNNQQELAAIYSAADVLVNPTREDNYPTVNMESIACGTPVITFRTGGSPEMVDDETGMVVNCEDIEALQKAIIKVCTDNPFSKTDCLGKSKTFDKHVKFQEYMNLYEGI